MGEQFPDKTSISFFRLSRLSRLSHLSHKKKEYVFHMVVGCITGTRAGQNGTGFCPTDYKQNK